LRGRLDGSAAELEELERARGIDPRSPDALLPLLGAARDAGEHARAIELREALRRLLFANNAGELHEVDFDVLNSAARDAGLRVLFLPKGQARLEPEAAGTAGALGRIVASVSDAMTDGTWFRLKACADERCRWAFYDQSKNRSGHWCSMEVCGNRSKARQFRRRQRAAS